jgi:hypothetical protein
MNARCLYRLSVSESIEEQVLPFLSGLTDTDSLRLWMRGVYTGQVDELIGRTIRFDIDMQRQEERRVNQLFSRAKGRTLLCRLVMQVGHLAMHET